MIADILDKAPVSGYQPSQEVKDLTKLAQRDYQAGFDILHREWEELNNYSVIERDQKDKRTFNSFVDEGVDDPDEAWKWRGTRSLARNKVMAMHAQTTSQYIIPRSFAQNDQDQEDRDAAEVMDATLEWMTVNSNYRPAFLLAWMGALVSPATYLEADYFDVYQTIKEKTDKGYRTKEILDEVLSGFQANVLSVDQVFITNAYEQDIQKQRGIVRVRYVDYYELEAKYGKHENWQYLSAGVRTVFNSTDGLFYDVMDDGNQYLVEEATHKRRRDDLEAVYLNGIYFGDSNPDWNPIKHRDNRDAPKYNLATFGYERIGEHYFYFKSLINRVGWDDKLIDAMYELQMNRELIDLDAPMLYSGFEKMSSSNIFPGAWVASPDPNAQVRPLLPPSRGSGYTAMQFIEDSIAKESAISETTEGQLPQASQKAYTVSQASQNAKTLIGGTLKSLAQSVSDYGKLMVNIIIQHLTAPEFEEITDKIKYRNFIVQEQVVGGKKVSKRIRFDEAIANMSPEEVKNYQMSLLKESGYPDNKEHIYVVNPFLWSKLKYMIRVEADALLPKNKEFEKMIAERLYTLLRQDPLANPEALLRDLLNTNNKNSDELMAKQIPNVMNPQSQKASPPSSATPGMTPMPSMLTA